MHSSIRRNKNSRSANPTTIDGWLHAVILYVPSTFKFLTFINLFIKVWKVINTTTEFVVNLSIKGSSSSFQTSAYLLQFTNILSFDIGLLLIAFSLFIYDKTLYILFSLMPVYLLLPISFFLLLEVLFNMACPVYTQLYTF